jgi:hypothetical protein
MASERDIPFSVAQRSTAVRRSPDNLIAVTGSWPVAGRPRPRFFFTVAVDFIYFMYYIIINVCSIRPSADFA